MLGNAKLLRYVDLRGLMWEISNATRRSAVLNSLGSLASTCPQLTLTELAESRAEEGARQQVRPAKQVAFLHRAAAQFGLAKKFRAADLLARRVPGAEIGGRRKHERWLDYFAHPNRRYPAITRNRKSFLEDRQRGAARAAHLAWREVPFFSSPMPQRPRHRSTSWQSRLPGSDAGCGIEGTQPFTHVSRSRAALYVSLRGDTGAFRWRQ